MRLCEFETTSRRQPFGLELLAWARYNRGDIPTNDDFDKIDRRVKSVYPQAELIEIHRRFVPASDGKEPTEVWWDFMWVDLSTCVILKREDCSVLHLVLNSRWFDMVARMEKREAYLGDSPYWSKRISRWFNEGMRKVHHVAAISRGCQKPTMWFRVSGINRTNHRTKHEDWGEPMNAPHWVLELGDRVEMRGEVK